MIHEITGYLSTVDQVTGEVILSVPGPKGEKGDTGAASTVPGPKGDKGDTGSSASVTSANITSALGFTPDAPTAPRTPTAHTHPLSQLTQSSATSGQVPTWNGTAWVPSTPAASGVSSVAGKTGAVTLATSDISGLQTALDGKQAAGTYATLIGGTVPSSQLPSYVDDVLEFATLAAFPTTGETGKIYVSTGSNKTYRWSGSAYVEMTSSPGSTDAVPEGATNLYFTAARAVSALASTLASYATQAWVTAQGFATTSSVSSAISALVTGVSSVAGKTGAVTLSSADVSGLAPVATSGAYADLSGKPTIPAAQVNSDWNSTSGVSQILNKPSLFSGAYSALTGIPSTFAPSAHTHPATDVTGLASVATTGAYSSLTGLPSLSAVATSGSASDLGTGTLPLARLDPLVAIDNINNNFTVGQTITAPANTSALTASYSVTGANTTALVSLTGTWNTTGAASGIRLNVTDTASAATSLLADLGVGSRTQYALTKSRQFWLFNSSPATQDASNFERGFLRWNSNVLEIGAEAGGTGTARTLAFSTSGTNRLTIDGSGNLAIASSSRLDFFGGRTSIDFSGVRIRNVGALGFSNANTDTNAIDCGVGRTSAGIIEINGGTSTTQGGALRDLRLRNLIHVSGVATTVTPANNGELLIEQTSNTSITFKMRGTDGTVRSASLALA